MGPTRWRPRSTRTSTQDSVRAALGRAGGTSDRRRRTRSRARRSNEQEREHARRRRGRLMTNQQVVRIPPAIVVGELADLLGVTGIDVIKELMKNGVM